MGLTGAMNTPNAEVTAMTDFLAILSESEMKFPHVSVD
jgi:hypothetical protein